MNQQIAKNTQQTIINKQLQQLVIDKVNEYTCGLEVVDSIHYHHIGHSLKNASVYKSVKIPDNITGITVCVVNTDKNMYCSLTICSKKDKNFNRRLGVYYALRSFLASDLSKCSATYLFPNNDIQSVADKYKAEDPTTKLNKENLFVKALIANAFYNKNIFENKLKNEVTYTKQLEKQILEDLKKQDIYVEQVAHFRPLISSQIVSEENTTEPTFLGFYPSSKIHSMNKDIATKMTKNILVSATGGFTVTFFKTPKDKNKYIISLANCSSKDVFSRSEGRFQSLLNYIQNKKNSVYQMTVNEGEDVFEKFTTTLKNTVMPNLK